MIYRKLIILITILMFVSSCGYYIAPKYIKKGYTIKYENKNTGIDTLININGYYEIDIPYRRTIYSKGWKMEVERYEYDTTHTRLVFYHNGIYLRDFNDYNSIYEGKAQNIEKYFLNVVYDTLGKIRERFYINSTWGSYKISHDTIKVQYVYKPHFGELATFWYAFESWYKVLDRNTIKEINLIPIHRMSKSDWDNWDDTKSERPFKTAKFIPVDTIPNPDNSWIIKRKWFWNNNERIK